MDAADVFQLFVGVLLLIAGKLIWDWKSKWETRVIAQDTRLDIHTIKHSEQDVVNAKMGKDITHIKETSDTMAADVKQLLIHSNGRRASTGN